MESQGAVATDIRPTKEEVDAAIAFGDPYPMHPDALVEWRQIAVLVAEVRALREELGAAQAEVRSEAARLELQDERDRLAARVADLEATLARASELPATFRAMAEEANQDGVVQMRIAFCRAASLVEEALEGDAQDQGGE